jgi:methylmalonyl-CoA mutase cobalamin-binding domain/chain
MMPHKLVDAIADMREEEALALTKEMLKSGASPLEILDHCREAMEIVGERYQAGEYFVPELVLAGEMLAEISALTKPMLAEAAVAGPEPLGKVVIGTVKGDIHDIGKNIVVFMLDANGFDVLDLGVDVPPARFVEATKEFQADVVGLSGFLTLALEPMRATVQALEEAGLRDKVRVMIGGIPVSDPIVKYAGADAWGKDAVAAVSLAKAWVGG